MAAFSISDTAFTGFGIVRHKPVVVLIWVVVQLIVSAVITSATVTFFGPLMGQAQGFSATAGADPAQAMAMLRQLAPFYAASLVFSVFFYAILFSTMNRAVLRPTEDAFGYIRLGADELRQLALVVIYFVLAIFAYIGLLIVGIIIAGLVASLANLGALAPLIALPLVLAGMAALGVKLSLASAQTFATGKLNLFGSWSLTKGRFWPMLGAYVIATCMFLIVFGLGYVVIVAVAAAAGGGVQSLVSQFMHPQMASLSQYFTPARIAQLVLSAALGAITLPILLTPAPAIYRGIIGASASPAEVF